MPAKIYAEPDSCGDGAYSIESIAGSDETSYTRTDLVEALIEVIKDRPTLVGMNPDFSGPLYKAIAALEKPE
jgi:hypothetical protein